VGALRQQDAQATPPEACATRNPRNFERWFAEYEGDIELETHDLSIAVNGDVAFAHMLHPDSGTRRNGQDVEVWVRSTVCAQRIDGQWLITHEHISFPINPENWSAVVDATT
jgi:ketosteroid isomerase-like protein